MSRSTTDAAGAKTVFYYDDLNRVTAEINALGTYTAYTHDDNGNVLTARVYENQVAVPADGGAKDEAPAAPSGSYRETSFTYDDLNRQLTGTAAGVDSYIWNGTSYVLQTATLTTANEYDAGGNLVKQTDANGNAVFHYYDKLGRKIHQVDQEQYRTDWSYDGEGNVLQEKRYAIALASAPVVGTLPAVSTSGDDRTTDYSYDKTGNRLTEIRRSVQVHDGSGAHTRRRMRR